MAVKFVFSCDGCRSERPSWSSNSTWYPLPPEWSTMKTFDGRGRLESEWILCRDCHDQFLIKIDQGRSQRQATDRHRPVR